MYKLINAIVFETTVKGSSATPMSGYLLEEIETKKRAVFSREEAYGLAEKFGCENASPRKREVSCEEDAPNENGDVFYLKLNEGRKINEMLLPERDIPAGTEKTPAYEKYVREKFGKETPKE